MQHVLEHLITILARGECAVLATVVDHAGSAPRTSGARLLISKDGGLVGSIGGGAAEGLCCTEAQRLLTSAACSARLNFTMTAGDAASAGMICGGSVSILLQKVEPEHKSFFEDLKTRYRSGQRPFLVTSLPHDGDRPDMTIVSAQQETGEPAPPLSDRIRNGPSRGAFLLSHDGCDYFVEPLVHPGTVHIMGGGHVGQATAFLADYAGFEVVIIDDRVEFANADRFPMARETRIVPDYRHCVEEMGPDDYIVIVTRGHLYDREVLAQALRTQAGYIGMIGSSRKRKTIYQAILQEGFTDEDLQRVHSPIGLRIGAETPQELGVSIVAELIKTRAGHAA